MLGILSLPNGLVETAQGEGGSNLRRQLKSPFAQAKLCTANQQNCAGDFFTLTLSGQQVSAN
jgi:hypothetical protein